MTIEDMYGNIREAAQSAADHAPTETTVYVGFRPDFKVPIRDHSTCGPIFGLVVVSANGHGEIPAGFEVKFGEFFDEVTTVLIKYLNLSCNLQRFPTVSRQHDYWEIEGTLIVYA